MVSEPSTGWPAEPPLYRLNFTGNFIAGLLSLEGLTHRAPHYTETGRVAIERKAVVAIPRNTDLRASLNKERVPYKFVLRERVDLDVLLRLKTALGHNGLAVVRHDSNEARERLTFLYVL